MSEPRLFARLAIVGALFALFSLPLLALGPPESPAWKAAPAHVPLELAIIGDSRAHVGVSPTEVVSALEHAGVSSVHAHNFAADGTDVLHHFDFVDRALLGAASRPRVIVWAPNPLGFNDGRTNNRLEQLPGMGLGPIYAAGAPFEMLLDLGTMGLFPPYRQRPIFAGKVGEYVERFGKKTLPFQTRVLGLSYREPPKSREYHALPDGQEPFTVLDWKDRFDRGIKGYEADYASLGKTDWHMKIARELLHRANAAGVLVVIVELPVAPYFRAHEGGDPRHLAWRRSLRAVADEEGALYWDHTARFDDDHVFGDPAHMSEPTAVTYSRYLGEQLALDARTRAALVRGR